MNFTPGLRRFVLTLHITASVGLLGAIMAFLTLAIAGLTGRDQGLVRGAYLSMQMIANAVVVPLALAALATGIVQGLCTPWGLFRHYWVLIKLLLTAFATAVLLAKLPMIAAAARLAAAGASALDLRDIGRQLLFHAAAGLAVLLVPTVLSVYKPRGLTRHGFRQLQKASGRA